MKKHLFYAIRIKENWINVFYKKRRIFLEVMNFYGKIVSQMLKQ
jgi:hypothetical protein